METKKYTITSEYLKNIFTTSDTSLISLSPKSDIEKHIKIEKNTMTPTSKRILDGLTPESRKRMADDINEDNIEFDEKERKSISDDPDYSYFENQEIGIILEKWICVNFKCKCGSNYLKYNNPNMPVIDIKCSNDNHDITFYGPKYYQIKSTEDKKMNHHGYKYFDITKHYIHVGSRKYGEICHSIKTSDKDKELLIGYMCITYRKINNDNIRIITKSSFILTPKTDASILSKSENYYEYITPYRKALIIDFKPDLFIKTPIESVDINIHQQYNQESIIKGLRLSYEQKYLKYKQKYLNLKNKLKYLY